MNPTDPTNFDISTTEGLANAVRWQSEHVAKVVPGGIWIVPRSLSAYRLLHADKVARKLSGYPEPDIQKVFEAMGWRVETL